MKQSEIEELVKQAYFEGFQSGSRSLVFGDNDLVYWQKNLVYWQNSLSLKRLKELKELKKNVL